MLKKLLVVFGVILVLLLGAVILGRCNASKNADSKSMPQQVEPAPTTASSETASNVIGSAAPIKIVITAPTVVNLGQAAQNVDVAISGAQTLGELALEITTGSPNLTVVDNDTQAPGIQFAPAALPAGATAKRMEVDAAGILHFQVQDFTINAASQNLLSFRIQGEKVGESTISVHLATASAPDGATIPVEIPAGIKVQVQNPAPVVVTLTPVPGSSADSAAPSGSAGEITAGIYYRIRRGQNLFRLSQTFGATVEAIAQANGITDVRRIPTGMLLRIPVASPKGQAAYLVGPDETLYSIAKTFGMTVEQLAQLNAIAPPYPLPAGIYLLLRP